MLYKIFTSVLSEITSTLAEIVTLYCVCHSPPLHQDQWWSKFNTLLFYDTRKKCRGL